MSTTLYIAGPMTGLPDFNYPAFNDAAARLRAAGFDVVNPAEDGLPLDAQWHQHLRVAIAKLVTCDAVATLPGWRTSTGALLEVAIAVRLGMRVRSAEGWVISKLPMPDTA
jgi:hypothetical protein